MTLMPVWNTSARGSSESNAGASRWISQRSVTPSSGWPPVSRGSPITLNTWPRVTSPTGTLMPAPVFTTMAPRLRPSVGFRATTRTRLSPICWATSPVMTTAWPSTSEVIWTAWLISGSAPRGNSTSTTGPAMATTWPSLRWPVCVLAVSVTVIGVYSGGRANGAGGSMHEGHAVEVVEVLAEGVGRREVVRQQRVRRVAVLAQGLGTAHDLHDLGGDGVL